MILCGDDVLQEATFLTLGNIKSLMIDYDNKKKEIHFICKTLFCNVDGNISL